MDKNEMARLVEALCEAPMDGAAEPSAELAALRREAAKLLAEAGDNPGDADAQIAALAASLSGSFGEVAPDTFAELVPRFASARLDVESATAFVEIMERSAGTAPADLVAEFSGAEAAAGLRPTENVWSRIAHGLRPARLSRIAAACAMIVVASAASWSVYWHEHDHEQLAAPPAPEAKTESAAPALAKTKSEEMDIRKIERAAPESTGPASGLAAPPPPAAQLPAPAAILEPAAKSAFAKRQPCEASAFALEFVQDEKRRVEEPRERQESRRRPHAPRLRRRTRRECRRGDEKSIRGHRAEAAKCDCSGRCRAAICRCANRGRASAGRFPRRGRQRSGGDDVFTACRQARDAPPGAVALGLAVHFSRRAYSPFAMIGAACQFDAIRSGDPRKLRESRAIASVVPVLPEVIPPNSPPLAYCCATSNAVPVRGGSIA